MNLFANTSAFCNKTPNNTYINNFVSYLFFGSLYFNFIDFSILNISYFIGLSYISSIEYYNGEQKKHVDTLDTKNKPDNIKNQSTLSGWVGFCSLVIFDKLLNIISIVISTKITRLLEIILYIFYSRHFIKFLKNKNAILEEIIKQIKDNTNDPLYSQHNRNITINNIFQSLLTDLIFINNVICGTICNEYNIIILSFLINPLEYFALYLIQIFDNISNNGIVESMPISIKIWGHIVLNNIIAIYCDITLKIYNIFNKEHVN
jgi:hypothetical protein